MSSPADLATVAAWRRTLDAARPPGGWSEPGSLDPEAIPGLELSGSAATLSAVFESTGDAIWAVDHRHRIQAFNSAYALTMEALTGRAPRVGDSPEVVAPPSLVRFIRNCYDRALAGHRFSVNRDQEMDGALRTWELFFHPSEGPDGAPGVVVFSKDITRRRQTEEELRLARLEAEEANRAKSLFMANMSHELRTPLNSVIGFANILLKRHQGDEASRDREFLERIVANGNHLLTLINQILDLSKIESGKLELDLEEVDLRELIPSVIRQLEGQLHDRPLELRFHWEVAPVPFLADPGKLKQVLINLVGNAIKFTEAGSVVVEAEADPEDGSPVAIHVRDTGIGIPQDRLEDIFKAFRQADGTTARRFGGTGLGLTISRSLCQVMGFSLVVESTEGRGSTFSIVLREGQWTGDAEASSFGAEGRQFAGTAGRWKPEIEGARKEGAGRANGVGNGRTSGSGMLPSLVPLDRGVAVVSHRPDLRSALTEHLRDLGCHVIVPTNANEALSGLRDGGVDVAILDFLIPGTSGWEVLEELRSHEAAVAVGSESRRETREPLILLTGIPDSEATGVGAVAAPTLRVDMEVWNGLEGRLPRVLGRNGLAAGQAAVLFQEEREVGDECAALFREHGVVVHRVADREAALDLLSRSETDLVVLRTRNIRLEHFSLLSALAGAGSAPDLRPPPPVLVVVDGPMRREDRVAFRRGAERSGSSGAPSSSRIAWEVERLLRG